MVAFKAHVTNPLRALSGRSASAHARAMELLDFLQLTDKADMPASALSYGDARRLEIARSLAGQPTLLLLDEPAAGMNEAETEQLTADIQKIRSSVKAVMLIEHDMSLIRRLSDRIIAMDYGKKICEGTPAQVLSHPEVKRAYLGDES